jgi:hypothetical protein
MVEHAFAPLNGFRRILLGLVLLNHHELFPDAHEMLAILNPLLKNRGGYRHDNGAVNQPTRLSVSRITSTIPRKQPTTVLITKSFDNSSIFLETHEARQTAG